MILASSIKGQWDNGETFPIAWDGGHGGKQWVGLCSCGAWAPLFVEFDS